MLKDYRRLPKTAPSSLVIMLHGVGANGEDLIDLADVLRPVLPGTAFLSPDAPEPCDMAPFGRQWFSLMDRSYAALKAGIEKSSPHLEGYIAAALKEYSLPASRCALLGFSQGTMMSLYTGPRQTPPLAGILGYSGMLLGAEDLKAVTFPPICLIHGTDDEVVSVEASKDAAGILRERGARVDLHLYEGLGHSIDNHGLSTGAAFLQRVLG
jgi:phospholipase/carboxylesterase